MSETGIIKIHIKLIPTIYHKLPSQEIDYALFLAEAKLSRRDSMSVIDFSNKIKIAGNRIEGVNKGLKNNFIVVEEEDFSRFWNEVLTVNLLKKYNVKPVHTLQEIMFLKKLFPKNIRLFVVYYEKNIVAGTVIFETENVAHAQYISASDNKNELGSLDFLYHHLITEVFAGKKYFDFGISNEQQGKKLNTGLIFWKESFGARTIVHDFYEVDTANYYKLENVAI